MTLHNECKELLKMLEEKGIKYPDPIYIKTKTIMTTIESISNHFIGIKKE